MMDWNTAETEWLGFLEQVRQTRANLGATYAGAWFRGQKHSWDLNPGILRELETLKNHVQFLKKERKKQKSHLKGCERYARKNNLVDDPRVTAEREILDRLDYQISKYEEKILTGHHVHGEGRAYVEYRFRSGTQQESSWKTLAEMQHYGIPTRLLDWSESFGTALAFALEDYIREIDDIWRKERKDWRLKSSEIHLSCNDVNVIVNDTLACPTLWITNPYRMAEESTGESVLWDYTLSQSDDYFGAFINEKCKESDRFDKPFPMLSPWKDERIAAQEGVFTFHGKSAIPLNKIYNKSIVDFIPISQGAAVYGVRFLFEFFGINRFSMFRDKDSLGQQVRREFFS